MKHLQALLFEKRVLKNWGFEQLPLVQRIFNAQIHSSTGVSPAELLFGNTVDLNRRIFTQAKTIEATSLTDYIDRMLLAQANILRAAQATQQAKDEYHIATHDVTYPTEYPINSWVLVTHPAGRRSKLETYKTGPFLVITNEGAQYTLQDTNTGRNFRLHVSTLTPFDYDPEHTDPTIIAAHDAGEFFVESILEHRGNRNQTSSMEWLVRWKGYGPEKDTWEPLAMLRDNVQFHEYCVLRLTPNAHLYPDRAQREIPLSSPEINDINDKCSDDESQVVRV